MAKVSIARREAEIRSALDEPYSGGDESITVIREQLRHIAIDYGAIEAQRVADKHDVPTVVGECLECWGINVHEPSCSRRKAR